MSATSCKTGTSWVFPSTPLGRNTAGCMTVGRDVTVALSTKSLRKCVHIPKDASWAGDSPGISLKTIGLLLFLLIDYWCDEIIIVPGPGTKAFSREGACPTIYKSPGLCWIVFLSHHIQNTRDMPSGCLSLGFSFFFFFFTKKVLLCVRCGRWRISQTLGPTWNLNII